MQIQGHQIDKLKGRFSGTVDEIDEDAFKFDKMVVMLVVGRTAIGSVDVKDDGEIHAVMKIKVEDMAALEGPVRDQAIAFLAHGANQGILDFGNYRHKGDEPKPPAIEGQSVLPVADYAQPPADVDADGVVGEALPARIVEGPDDEFDVPVVAPPPVTPQPTDAEPRTARDPAPAPTGTVVGQVRRAGRKDEALDAFLNE